MTFSPNSAGNLPSFLSRYNAIETNITGVKQSDNDGFWIRKIVDTIEGSRARKLIKLKKNIFIASQIIAALLVIY